MQLLGMKEGEFKTAAKWVIAKVGGVEGEDREINSEEIEDRP